MNNFNLQAFLDCANELVRADEVERALWLLDNLPGYYRDHRPIEVIQLRNEIMARVCTPATYAGLDVDQRTYSTSDTYMRGQLRAEMMVKEVKGLNQQGLKPHVIDFAPGEHWLEATLAQEELKFTYETISLKPEQTKPVRQPDQPVVFCAFEIIEHLWNETDLKIESLKCGTLPHLIHVSTPLYSFDTECLDWRSRELLGHLRTYTPGEFYSVLMKMFPEYQLVVYRSKVMHARLVLKEMEFNIPTGPEFTC